MKEKKFSKVAIRETNETKKVRIGSDLKPEVSEELIEKWQSLLDVTARIIDVPAASIMKLHEDYIEVFLNSQIVENPLYAGQKIELIYGVYCETTIGKQQKLLVPDATKSEIWKHHKHAIDLNLISYLGFPVNYPDGEVFGTLCVHDNKENHYNELHKDLMDKMRQHIETDLELLISNHQLEQSNEMKSKFLSLISHDVRGAVSSLDGFIELLISRFHSYERNELQNKLKTIRVTTNSLNQTLQNLLTWSKQDFVQLQPYKKQVDLIAVLTKILDFLKPRIEYKALEVNTDYPSEGVFVHADPNMLETALRNIISNAVKFTENEGKIFIRVFETEQGVEIEIEDTGMGMDEKTANKLFTYNYSEGTDDKGQESSGIGLLLSKEFLDKNDATVKVSSKLGEGSRFTVTI
ncbi:MAG: GAF domain-containing sensor histidine kinase [Bacteroidales bacterium]|nr:GAF domain-containing sensor histidine kinase [Bacteroidales bacterium]